jgi:hypothetical protein
MTKEIIPLERVAQSIYLLRGQKVMLDVDLAVLYGVATKVLNQAVKRNRERFPPDFTFQLNGKETANLRSRFVISSLQPAKNQGNLSNRSQFVTGSFKHAIRQLMAPPTKLRREIGFHIRERAPRYRTRERQ